jgi:hypothetical protein
LVLAVKSFNAEDYVFFGWAIRVHVSLLDGATSGRKPWFFMDSVSVSTGPPVA